MNRAQRIVLVVALGVVTVVVASAVQASFRPTTGWFNYAPNTALLYESVPGSPWRDAAVWIAATGAWALASIRLLRTEPSERESVGVDDVADPR